MLSQMSFRLIRRCAQASLLATIIGSTAWAYAAPNPPTSSPLAFAAPVDWITHLLASQTFWVWFVAAFLGGLALNLTPCVYPMIPVTLAFFSGQAAGRMRSLLALGMLYVLGMSLTYAVLGFVAAKTGALFGSWLQHPVVLIGISLLVAALAVSMFGVYELRPPRWIAQRFGQASAGRWGALTMGLTVGFIAAPCIGPFVLGLLLFVSQLANPLLGFWLFLTMGLGMGLPYVLLGAFANRISRWPKAGAWLVWVKKAMGVILFGLALYFVRPLMPATVFHWFVAGGLVSAGVYLGWIESSRFQGTWMRVKRLVGLTILGTAVAFAPIRHGSETSLVTWQPYTPARFQEAVHEGRPVVVDVYADWCLPCQELDHVTFRNPRVSTQLSQFVTLRVDATREVPPQAEALLDRYEIYGVPTVLIFDATGRERSDLRVSGFVNASEFLERLTRVKAP